MVCSNDCNVAGRKDLFQEQIYHIANETRENIPVSVWVTYYIFFSLYQNLNGGESQVLFLQILFRELEPVKHIFVRLKHFTIVAIA